MRIETVNAWDRALKALATEIEPLDFNTWIKPIVFVGQKDDSIHLEVPSPTFKERVENSFGEKIIRALQQVSHITNVVFFVRIVSEKKAPIENFSPVSAPPAETGLNSRYTFDKFVVGASNQFAHAAAMAVSKSPGQSYNPLFIYGGVGLGKTHLLNAIGNHIHQTYAGLNVILMPSVSFMNEFINAMQKERIPEFRMKFRSVDVLLIDDIQYIAGKGKTSQEFFFAFNHLHDRRKQIVISSDSAPKDIRDLEERLHSRFEWGLVADIRPPDLETKIAILKRKANIDNIDLNDDVALFVASKIKSNIRELEGALTRLAAFASLKGVEISMALTKEVLRDFINLEEKVITVELIQKVVAEEYSLRITELKSKNNAQKIAFPRQVAMYISKELTEDSLPEIGKAFSGKHHSTVIYSIAKIEALRKSDPEFNKQINSIIERFR